MIYITNTSVLSKWKIPFHVKLTLFFLFYCMFCTTWYNSFMNIFHYILAHNMFSQCIYLSSSSNLKYDSPFSIGGEL